MITTTTDTALRSILCAGAMLLATVATQAQTSQTPSGFRVTGTPRPAGTLTTSRSGQAMSARVGAASQPTRSPSQTIIPGVPHPGSSAMSAFRCVLDAGWNLRSFPFSPRETIGDLLVGAAGYPIKVGNLYTWSGGAYDEVADADHVAHNLGFWVYSYWGGEARPATPTATVPRQLLVDQLVHGWNLFGPSEYVSLPSDRSEIRAAWEWDSQNQVYVQLEPTSLLYPGKAYWLFRQDQAVRAPEDPAGPSPR